MKKLFFVLCLSFCFSLSAVAQEPFVYATCPTDKPLMGKDGKCYSCDTPKEIKLVRMADCSALCKTPDGKYLRENDFTSCILSACPDGTKRDEWGNCPCPNGVKKDEWGECPCPNGMERFNETCQKVAPCSKEKPLLGKNGYCYSCDELDRVKLKKESSCDLCVNEKGEKTRVSNFFGCILSVCPQGTYRDSLGGCNPHEQNDEQLMCPDDKPLRVKNKCYPCDYDQVLDMPDNEIEKCHTLCLDENKNPTRKIYRNLGCGLKKCPPDKPLLADGSCYACDELNNIPAENCAVCGDTRLFGKKDGETVCMLRQCPTSHPLPDIKGNCYSCDIDEELIVADGMCQQVCPRRKAKKDKEMVYMEIDPLKYEKCIFEEEIQPLNGPKTISFDRVKSKEDTVYNPCPADKPVMDFQGGCNACDVPGDILLGSGCEKCPQRKQSGSWQINDIKGNKCVLK